MIDPWKLHRLLAEFNNRLPGEQELYILVRLYLTTAELAVLSRPPSWTRFTSKAILVSLVVLCFQCFYNLYLMISLGGFTLGKKTSLGMWNTETVNCNTLTTLAFVMLSLLDWSWKEYNTSRHRQEFTPNLLVHVTFIPVLLGTWCFVWATVCHCVSIFWYRRNYSSATREKNTLPTPLRWISHAFFLLPVMLISTCILLATIRTYYSRENEIQMIREMMENLTQAMLSLEGSIERANLNTRLLISFQKANSYRIEAITCLNVALIAYSCALAFLLIVFMPLLCVSWRDLSLKAEFLSMKLSQERNENSLELTRLMETTQDARTTLLYRSFSVFFGMTACMPVLCWQLYYSQKAFSGMSTQYYAISYFLSQGVVSFFVNIILLIINVHCTKIRARQNRPPLAQPIDMPMRPPLASDELHKTSSTIHSALIHPSD